MLSKMKETFHTFAYVVTGVLFACALFITVFNREEMVPSNLLWQILAASFLCTLGNFIYPNSKISRRERIICTLLHYLYTNIVVFGCARVFRWFDVENLIMNIFMFLSIGSIFLAVSYVIRRQNRKLSALLNERLEQYQNKI